MQGLTRQFCFVAILASGQAFAAKPEVIIDSGGVNPQALTVITNSVNVIATQAEDQDGGEADRLRRRARDATAAALATLSALETGDILANSQATGEFLRHSLRSIEGVREVRGEGLLVGFDLEQDLAPAVVTAALDAGFIINATGPATLRLAPPLILTTDQAQSFLDQLPALLQAAAATTIGQP